MNDVIKTRRDTIAKPTNDFTVTEDYKILADQDWPRVYCPQCSSYNVTWATHRNQKCLTCRARWMVKGKVPDGIDVRKGVDL